MSKIEALKLDPTTRATATVGNTVNSLILVLNQQVPGGVAQTRALQLAQEIRQLAYAAIDPPALQPPALAK